MGLFLTRHYVQIQIISTLSPDNYSRKKSCFITLRNWLITFRAFKNRLAKMLIKYPVDFFANPKNVFTFAVPKNAGVMFNLQN
jgi:hypothetical protein